MAKGNFSNHNETDPIQGKSNEGRSSGSPHGTVIVTELLGKICKI